MSGRKLFRSILTLGVTLGTLLSATGVASASGGVTQGDVQSALQSWDTGLRAVRLIAGVVAAAPMQGLLRGRIAPADDGRHYCVDDWHMVQLAWVDGGDKSFTYQDAVADLSTIGNTFIMDGVTLTTTQTPITRRVVPFEGDYVDYGFSVGSILSPSALGVGAHTLKWLATFPDPNDSFETESTVYMDASGTGACLQ